MDWERVWEVLGGLVAIRRVLGGVRGVSERFWGVLSPADPQRCRPQQDADGDWGLRDVGLVFLALGLGFYVRKKSS